MKLKKFLKDIRKEEKNFKIAPLYLYATEAVGEYYKKLSIKGKKVLSICGSGDQILNAYFYGAKEVVAFDLVENTKFMLNLKIAAIKILNRKEFLEFFGDNKKIGNFNHKKYLQMGGNLDKKTMAYFDKLYSIFGKKNKKILHSDHFRARKEFYIKLYQINHFLKSDHNYKKLQKILKNKKVKFIKSSIENIHKKTNKKFDLINLSNVPNYILGEFKRKDVKDRLKKFNKILIKMKKVLEKKGKIISYIFYYSQNAKIRPLLLEGSSIEKLKEFGDFKISRMNVKGILYKQDTVTIFQNI